MTYFNQSPGFFTYKTYMQRTQFCSCYKPDAYWICALYYMSITTLARCLSQDWGFSAIYSVLIQQKRATINKNALSFQNEMSLQKLLQCSVCKGVNNINFQKSPNIWVAADLHFGVISSPALSSVPHAWSQGFTLYLPEMDCIAAGSHMAVYSTQIY